MEKRQNNQDMDKMGEMELWHEYKETGSHEIKDYFVKKYYPLVKYAAGKVTMKMPQNIEFDDLVSYGVFGLLDAIEKYNPYRKVAFKSYAYIRIRGAILDELREMDYL